MSPGEYFSWKFQCVKYDYTFFNKKEHDRNSLRFQTRLLNTKPRSVLLYSIVYGMYENSSCLAFPNDII